MASFYIALSIIAFIISISFYFARLQIKAKAAISDIKTLKQKAEKISEINNRWADFISNGTVHYLKKKSNATSDQPKT